MNKIKPPGSCIKRVYIAGPITVNKERYKECFNKAEQYLRTKGYDVINPALDEYDNEAFKAGHKSQWTNDAWLFYMQRDIGLVSSCDAVYLLKHWEESPGARIEKIVAEKFNLKIMYEE